MSTELETLLVNGITNIIRAAVLLETNKLNADADNTVATVSKMVKEVVKKPVQATVAKAAEHAEEPAPNMAQETLHNNSYKTITRSELVAKLQEVMSEHGRDTVLSLFKEFDAANLSEIKESDYAKLAEMIDTL